MYSGRGRLMSVDLSLLNLPRVQPVEDLQAYLQAAVHSPTPTDFQSGGTTGRVPGPVGQVGDSLSEVRPVEAFGGEAVIDGVY